MIEQAMIFALGFLLAGLLALAIAPAFWRRAMGLTRRRLEARVPVSIQEILAERDLLRAQNAVECRQLEAKITALNRTHAAALGELGRRAAEILSLEADLAALEKERAAPLEENRKLERELDEVRAAAAAADKALFDAEAMHRRLRDEIHARNQELSSTAALAEVRLASLTTAENYAKGLERQVAGLRAEVLARQNQLREKARASLGRGGEVIDALQSENAGLNGALEIARLRRAELEEEIAALRQGNGATPAAALEENAILRQSISDIGTAMIKLVQRASEPPAAEELPKTATTAAELWVANGEASHDNLGSLPVATADHAAIGQGHAVTATPVDFESQA